MPLYDVEKDARVFFLEFPDDLGDPVYGTD